MTVPPVTLSGKVVVLELARKKFELQALTYFLKYWFAANQYQPFRCLHGLFKVLSHCLTIKEQGRGVSIVVSILAFYSDDLSLNPAGY